MTATENKEQTEATEPVSAPKRSHESLFGTLLFFVIALCVITLVAGLAWGGYRGFRLNQEQTALPSIGDLATEEKAAVPTEETSPQPAAPAEEKATSPDTGVATKAKGTDLKVLNGGAAKGSAGVAADVLKKDGYTKVTTGNTLKDYSGVTIYHAAGLEKEAEVVKTSLVKTYPKVEAKAALKDNTETSQAPLTVILGK